MIPELEILVAKQARRMVRPAALVALAAVAGIGLHAWAQHDAETTRRAFFEPVEVPLVSVDVYVTDSAGRPVGGLSLEDFEVFEDGVQVTPTHFYAAPAARSATAEEAEPPPEPVEMTSPSDQLLMAVWVDETGLRPQRRRAALDHLREFLVDDLPDSVEVALVSYDGDARVRQTFTQDRDELSVALDALVEAGASVSRISEEQDLIRRIQNSRNSASLMGTRGFEVEGTDLLGRVQAYAAQAYQRAQHSMQSLGAFVDSLAVLPGQKIVLVVSDAVNPRPGERVFAELQTLGQNSGVSDLSAMNFGRRYDLSREFRELLRRANTNRVTFMTLSAMAERNLGFVSAESRGRSAADMDQLMVEEQALLTMAGVTGGKMLENTAGLSAQLDQVAEEVAAYYSVAYTPPTPSDGEYHRLEIRVKREGVDVRHREGYVGTAVADGLVEQTMAAVMLGVTENPLDVAVEARPQEPREDGTFMVPLLVRVPIGELVLVPGAEQHEGRISLVMVVRSEDGGLSEPEVREYPIVVPNHELVQATSASAGYTLGLVMRPGPHRIAVGVRDDLARTAATAVASVTVGGEG